MAILSGYKKFKKYLRTGEGYKLCSEWTKSDSVEMADGSTLQESMNAVVSDVENTQNDITDVHDELMTSLGGMTFGVDAAGRYGYIKAGADTVTPFKNGAQIATFSPTWICVNQGISSPYVSFSINGSSIKIVNGGRNGTHGGDTTKFTSTFRTSEKYPYHNCISFSCSASVTTTSAEGWPIRVSYGNQSGYLSLSSNTSGTILNTYEGSTRPSEGDGYIYLTVDSAIHTYGYPAAEVTYNINNFKIIY